MRETPRGLDPGEELEAVADALDERGYEPYVAAPGCLRMHNCRFHPVACQSPDVVCDLNVQLCQGLLEGMAVDSIEAVRVPRTGSAGCCIEMRLRAARVADVADAGAPGEPSTA